MDESQRNGMLKNATEPTFDNTSELRIAERTKSIMQKDRTSEESPGEEGEGEQRRDENRGEDERVTCYEILQEVRDGL